MELQPRKASRFFEVPSAPPVKIFQLDRDCKEDPYPQKVNLTIGAYRNEDGQPWVLPVVKAVEQQMASDETLNKEYLPQEGMKSFSEAAMRLVLGNASEALVQNRCFGFQTLSGTGALCLAVSFLAKCAAVEAIYLPSPTWPNHYHIVKEIRETKIKQYRYYDPVTKGLDFEGMIDDIRSAPNGSVILLHLCAHNPTGVDPTKEQWNQIADTIKTKDHFVIFDAAYIGFASGDVNEDSYPARLFVSKGLEFFVAQSFSKNFGLYNERTGNLTVVLRQTEACEPVKSHMKLIVRRIWSSPPAHGARIVATVLNNPALFADWKECLKVMSDRMKTSRQLLYDRLKQYGCPGDWSHILKQIGMFSYTGLSAEQADHLISKYHIYTVNGRINVCGVTSQNVDYIAKAIYGTVTGVTTNGTSSAIFNV